MLTSLRQRLSSFRRRPSPIASLIDFTFWTLRFGLPPWKLKFYIVLCVIAAGVIGNYAFPQQSVLLITLTILFSAGVVFVLMLSYFRTFMGAEFATLKQSDERLATRIAEANGIAIRIAEENGMAMQGHSSNMSNVTQIDPEVMDAVVNASLSRLLESDFIAEIATAHDQLLQNLADLQVKLNQGGAPITELTQLRAELQSLQRRTERQLRLDSGAIAQMTAQIDELATEYFTSVKSRASRPKSV